MIAYCHVKTAKNPDISLGTAQNKSNSAKFVACMDIYLQNANFRVKSAKNPDTSLRNAYGVKIAKRTLMTQKYARNVKFAKSAIRRVIMCINAKCLAFTARDLDIKQKTVLKRRLGEKRFKAPMQTNPKYFKNKSLMMSQSL